MKKRIVNEEAFIVVSSITLSIIFIAGMVNLWFNLTADQNEGYVGASYSMSVSDKPAPKTLENTRENDLEARGLSHDENGNRRVQPVESVGTEWSADNFRESGELVYNNVTYRWVHIDSLGDGQSFSAEGYLIDSDNLIVCSNSRYPVQSQVWSPIGYMRVYDTNTGPWEAVVYTNW